jgi:hypothetical protein
MATWQLARIVSLKKDVCYTSNVSSSKGGMNNCFRPISLPKH